MVVVAAGITMTTLLLLLIISMVYLPIEVVVALSLDLQTKQQGAHVGVIVGQVVRVHLYVMR